MINRAFVNFLGVTILNVVAGIKHNELVAMNLSCSTEGFCNGDLKESLENCFCDKMCAEYGDCCPDATNYSLQKQTLTETYTCVDLGYGAVYMKGRCMAGWDDPEIMELCEAGSPVNFSISRDPLAHLPVTSNATSRTYTNYYCAICNNDSTSLAFWKTRVDCSVPTDRNLTKEYIVTNLVFEKDTWGIHLSFKGVKEFYPCFINLLIQETTRKCYPATKSCDENWSDALVEDLCHSYTAVRYVWGSTWSYRNPHCAQCNFIPREDTACFEVTLRSETDFEIYIGHPAPFSLLVDFIDHSGNTDVGATSVCQPGEIYDSFFKKCRNVVCGKEDQLYFSGKCTSVSDSQVLTVNKPTDSASVPNTTGKAHNETDEAHKCVKILMSDDEFTSFENGTVFVEAYGRIYLMEEYEASEGGILVCSPQTSTEKFSQTMGWVSLAGLGLSSVCLLLHLLIFLLVSHLKNLPGISMASLCLSLLTAYIIFIVSTFVRPNTTECYVLGAAMYYCFLASFCWMNVMAFDVWQTLRKASKELRVSSGRQRTKLVAYSVYGWLLPALAVVVMVTIDWVAPASLPSEFLPSLGQRWCWFGQRKALMVFFGAPLLTVMLLNILFFFATAYTIAGSRESELRVSSSSHQKKRFWMYIRLTVLMGLGWISGIVAGYLQLEAAWYFFVVLNTLQGVFIFLAFTCRSKVWQELKQVCQQCLEAAQCGISGSGPGVRSTGPPQESPNASDSQLSVHTESSHL